MGTFNTEIDAALAYDKAARAYFKEFAFLNFPEITIYQINVPIKFKGIRRLQNGMWESRIQRNGKRKTLGTFKTQEAALQSYKDAYASFKK